jgi:hypothetical protein
MRAETQGQMCGNASAAATVSGSTQAGWSVASNVEWMPLACMAFGAFQTLEKAQNNPRLKY